jgi:hypothetical protein
LKLRVDLLERERIVARPGFNRWLVPPAALCGAAGRLARAQRPAQSGRRLDLWGAGVALESAIVIFQVAR